MNIRGVFLAAVCVSSFFLATGRAQAQAIYLSIPGIPGEVVSPAAFAGQIEVYSMSVGASRPCGFGQFSLSSLNLIKKTDKATVKLSVALRDNTVLPTATLTFTRSDGQVYQVYQLNSAVVESLQTSGSSSEFPSTESVSFAAAQMSVTYTFFDGSGKPAGSENMTFTSASCP